MSSAFARVKILVRWARSSVWAYPVFMLLMVCILAAFRVSGTSVGVFHQNLYGPSKPDPSLLYGHPQPTRSDEWLVATPFTVSQSKNGFKRINPDVGSGMDATVLLDLPNKDWSTVFKPENWSFLVLPLENAFAFKWWFIAYLLLMSVYALTLMMLPGRKLLGIVLSLGFLAMPFLQWWYQTMTLAAVFWPCFAIVIFARLIREKLLAKKLLWALALAYVLTCFALVLYPPFQIPCAMVAAAICLGLWLQLKQGGKMTWRMSIKALLPATASVLFACAILIVFMLTRLDTVKAIKGTTYPGDRVVASGGYSARDFMDGFASFELQRDVRSHYRAIQSESSNFIMLWPFLILPSCYLAYRTWRKKRTICFPLVFLGGLAALLCLRLFVTMPGIFGKLLLLSSIPHQRLIIGFGFLNLLLLLVIMQQLRKQGLPRRIAVAAGAIAVMVQLLVGLGIRHDYPGYLSSKGLIVVLSLVIGAIVYLILARKETAGVMLLLALCLGSTYGIHPLYRGLGELTSSRMVSEAQKVQGDRAAGWTFVGDITENNLLVAGGIKSYAATYPYPQAAVDHAWDPEGKFENVYNRYAYANFVPASAQRENFNLVGVDSYTIRYDPCDDRFKRYITRVVSEVKLEGECLVEGPTLRYPNKEFFYYAVR